VTTIERNRLEFNDIDILSNNGRNFSSVSIVTNLNSNIYTDLSTQNATENKDCTSAQTIFNCNMSFSGHKQAKPLPRSTANLKVRTNKSFENDLSNTA